MGNPTHVVGFMNINGSDFPFDEVLVDDTPINFSNGGITYYLEQLSLNGAIGIWVSQGGVTHTIIAALSVALSGLCQSAAVNHVSAQTFGSRYDYLQDGTIKIQGEFSANVPWTGSSYTVPAPLPSSSFGVQLSIYGSNGSGLLLGFIPVFTTWRTVQQSPVTMVLG